MSSRCPAGRSRRGWRFGGSAWYVAAMNDAELRAFGERLARLAIPAAERDQPIQRRFPRNSAMSARGRCYVVAPPPPSDAAAFVATWLAANARPTSSAGSLHGWCDGTPAGWWSWAVHHNGGSPARRRACRRPSVAGRPSTILDVKALDAARHARWRAARARLALTPPETFAQWHRDAAAAWARHNPPSKVPLVRRAPVGQP